jgi:acetoin utilization protein AcuB
MIVRHWMTKDVVTINKEASIQEALAIMKHHSIRHLPVVDVDKMLLGWVTDADLRGVLIASMLEELTLEDVMVRKPYTAAPEMLLEEAAHVILEKRINGLPVLEEGRLLGVITVVDILTAFVTVLGTFTQSSRLDVKLSKPNVSLQEVTRVVQDHGAEIISICQLPSFEEEHVYTIRTKKFDLKSVVAELREKGVEVFATVQ